MLCAIWYHFYNLRNVKNTNRGVFLLLPATLRKVALPHVCFSRFLNCTNDTEFYNASQVKISMKFIIVKYLQLFLEVLQMPYKANTFKGGNEDKLQYLSIIYVGRYVFVLWLRTTIERQLYRYEQNSGFYLVQLEPNGVNFRENV